MQRWLLHRSRGHQARLTLTSRRRGWWWGGKRSRGVVVGVQSSARRWRCTRRDADDGTESRRNASRNNLRYRSIPCGACALPFHCRRRRLRFLYGRPPRASPSANFGRAHAHAPSPFSRPFVRRVSEIATRPPIIVIIITISYAPFNPFTMFSTSQCAYPPPASIRRAVSRGTWPNARDLSARLHPYGILLCDTARRTNPACILLLWY